jgi:hypothetical protein
MAWLTNTLFLTKERGFFVADYEIAEDFIPIRIKYQNKNSDHA